jgi:hypothetical protein
MLPRRVILRENYFLKRSPVSTEENPLGEHVPQLVDFFCSPQALSSTDSATQPFLKYLTI